MKVTRPMHANTGHVSGSPEMRFTNSGKPVLRFFLAVDDTGEVEEWNAWEAHAETLAELLHDGTHVWCSGKLKVHEWMDRSENVHTREFYQLVHYTILQ